MIDSVIKKLKKFSKEDFPVAEVSSYLTNLQFEIDVLKKYYFNVSKRYTRNLIHRDNNFEIMIICWAPKVSAPIHGHEGEKCWAKVLNGTLQICNYQEVSKKKREIQLTKKVLCDPGYLDGPADIHSVENLSEEFATSFHVYARPYDACDIYDLNSGDVRRTKLGYYSNRGIIS